MEKITKKELQEKLFGTQLSDDELEKIAGSSSDECFQKCLTMSRTMPLTEHECRVVCGFQENS